jgi:hypothetical protein
VHCDVHPFASVTTTVRTVEADVPAVYVTKIDDPATAQVVTLQPALAPVASKLAEQVIVPVPPIIDPPTRLPVELQVGFVVGATSAQEIATG